tara:strand:- start:32 stop:382 length:351 start_codon:yes stop_codon:yes gene_type:complete
MSLKLLDILYEEKEKCQYQFRDIAGDVYYKKCGKDKNWRFTDDVDYLKNSKQSNIVNWVEKKPNNQPKVRQLDVPQKKGDQLEDLKIYYTNLSPNNYEVKIEDGRIVIKPSPLKYQ